jgi:hypothetical protein
MLRLAGLDMPSRKTEAAGGGHRRAPPDREKEFTPPRNGDDTAFHRSFFTLCVYHDSTATGESCTPEERAVVPHAARFPQPQAEPVSGTPP